MSEPNEATSITLGDWEVLEDNGALDATGGLKFSAKTAIILLTRLLQKIDPGIDRRAAENVPLTTLGKVGDILSLMTKKHEGAASRPTLPPS